jgi:transposase
MDSAPNMIRGGFLTPEDRKDLVELARDGSAEHRLGRRANALVLLDDGWSCESVGKALLLDDDTIRTWYRLFREDGVEGLAGFGYEGSSCRLSSEQQDKLAIWVAETLPRTTREVGAWIDREFGVALPGFRGVVNRRPAAAIGLRCVRGTAIAPTFFG